eukprot:TRINITY_DN3092_c4_g1_i1.p3 TRINITY_DN3092_c4_g1~~TRINITY_DN3092_c4_g1_i1.p3  ORF type:complete len:252 (-),score=35.25 TRINITY_DN3092_c4_g1_i1:69-824(-)
MSHIHVERVTQLLLNKKLSIAKLALEIVNLVCAGPAECVEEFITGNGILALKYLLVSPEHQKLLKGVCLVLSNIMVGPEKHIQEVINAGVIAELSNLAVKSNDFGVRKEAAWAIGNACIKGSNYQKLRIVKEDVLEVLVTMLGNEDADLLLILLEAVDSLLELDKVMETEPTVCDQFEGLGGITKLEELQLHKNEIVYKKVVELMDKRFHLEEVSELPQNDKEKAEGTRQYMERQVNSLFVCSQYYSRMTV